MKDYESSYLCPCNVNTLPPLSLPAGVLGSSVTYFSSSSPKMLDNSHCCFKFTWRCIWKRGQFGVCYIMTFYCRLSEKHSGTRKELHHFTMQKCTILALSMDLVWCNCSKAVLKCCRQMAKFTLQSWWPFLPPFCLICKVYRSVETHKLGNGRRIHLKSKRGQ